GMFRAKKSIAALLAALTFAFVQTSARAQSTTPSFLPSTIGTDAGIIWRDYSTPSVPSSGPQQPHKPDIRSLFSVIQSVLTANGTPLDFLPQIASGAVLGNDTGSTGDVTSPWMVSNLSDTTIPLFRGTTDTNETACFNDSVGTIIDCATGGT